ncbi:acyltransferase [Aerococcus urinaeequi]|uniref:acyltransferase n=1 Tax=Aerococcus urinaeequi TaxID=51665 RepID=UPI003ED92B4E
MLRRILRIILYTNYFFKVKANPKLFCNSSKNNYVWHSKVKNKGYENSILLKGDILIKNCQFKITGNNNKVLLDTGIELRDCNITIRGDNNTIIIGKNCQFKELDLNLTGDNNIFECQSETTSSGHIECQIREACKIHIGENCLLSRNIIIRTSDSHPIYSEENKRINFAENVIIGNNCWVSQNVTLLKGTELPNGTIVGSGSIVTKAFSELNSVIVGSPAQVVRTKVRWERYL